MKVGTKKKNKTKINKKKKKRSFGNSFLRMKKNGWINWLTDLTDRSILTKIPTNRKKNNNKKNKNKRERERRFFPRAYLVWSWWWQTG